MPFVSVNGRAIHYTSAPVRGPARAPAVLFLHGAGGTQENWRFQMRYLGPKWYTVAVDLPGHGGSQGEGSCSVAEYRDFAWEFLDALALSRVVLVGHSMGGGIAQSFALAYPDRLAALVLVGTGARLRVHPDIFAAIHKSVEEAARLISGWAFSSDALPATVAQGAEVFARNREAVLEGDFMACDAFDLTGEIAAIRAPTLVLCGGEDRLTPVKYARFLQQRIPGATLDIVPGAGHMVMLEKPADVNRSLTAFLDIHVGSMT